MSGRAKRAPNALAAVTGLWLFSAPCSRVLTTRAGGSRVVESLVVRKEPPSSTVRSRSLRVLADGRTTASSVCGSRRSTRRPTGRPTSSRSPPARSRDAGLTTQREYEITSSSRGADPLGRALHDLVSVRTGGYDLEPESAGGTRLRDVQRARGPRPGEGFRRPSRCDRRKGAGDFVGAVKRAVEAAGLDSHPSRVRCGARSLHRLGAWTWRPSSRRVSAVDPPAPALIAATGIRTNQTSLGPCAGSCPGAQTRALLRTRIGVRSPRCCSSCPTVSQYAFATTRSSPLSAEQLARAHPVERRALVVLP